ncbi:MAG TPA: hypothetical protein VGP33_15975 [Chloroflexota bacterium]|nr:hypothetical protein [Chloroflexota bacterium]
MVFAFGVVLLILAAGYLWLEHCVQREAAAPPVPQAVYACRQCGRPVGMAATVRPIRLTLLCPEHYHAQYGAMRPVPGPRKRRYNHHTTERGRPVVTILPRR